MLGNRIWHRMAFFRLACCAVLLCALLVRIKSDGGTFHEYPSTPEARNSIRYKVGTCNTWNDVKLPDAASSAAGNMTISGPATLWMYRYQNCSTSWSVCVEVNLTISEGGKPAAGRTFMGYSHVGSCAAGPGAKYQLNATAQEAESYVWFWGAVTNSSGRIWGQGGNDGFLSTAAPSGLASFVIYDEDMEYEQNMIVPLACCDFTFVAAKTTNWSTLLPPGGMCVEDAHAGQTNGTGNGSRNSSMSGNAGFLATSTSGLHMLAVLVLLLVVL